MYFEPQLAYSNETRSLIQYKKNNLLMAISAFAKYAQNFQYIYIYIFFFFLVMRKFLYICIHKSVHTHDIGILEV